jgi:dolichol-phosphate mannosyltransferase
VSSALDDSNWAVPTFAVTELRPRSSKYCVVIPVINEGERILSQLKLMKTLKDMPDIVIADGGSTDGSMEPTRLGELGVRTVLVKTGPGKLSAQMRMGLAYAMRQGYEGVILIDGNGKDEPSAISNFVSALDEGFDHIQGSRFVPGGKAINTPLARLWGIKLVHAPLISLAAGYRYTDTTNGFRAYSRRFLIDPRVAPFRETFSAYELHYYLSIRAARLRFRVSEIPVTRAYPSHGPTPTKIKSFRGNFLVLKTLVEASIGKYNPR